MDGFEDEWTVRLAEVIPSGKSTGTGFRTVRRKDGDVIQYAGQDSPYVVRVRRLVAIDGLKGAQPPAPNEQRMSLLVLDYDLTSEGQYKTVKTELVLKDLDDTTTDRLAKPKIVAYAPFYTRTQWSPSTEEQKRVRTLGFEFGAGNFIEAKVQPSVSWEVAKTKQYFSTGIAQRIYTGEGDGHLHGITWVLKQNPSAREGTPPTFRVAVLYERASDAPVTIEYKFECEIGVFRNLQNRVLRWFDSGLYRHSLIEYTPRDESRGFMEGEEIVAKLDRFKTNLGYLRDHSEELTSLTPVWGLEPRDEI